MKKKYLKFSQKVAKKAGLKLKESFRSENADKRGTSKEVKSIFDHLMDDLIKKGIEKEFPEHSYLTEESGLVDKGGDFLWIIDPLDGTGNFENHNPFYSVSISLWRNGTPLLGVIEAPSLGERFFGIVNEGSYRQDIETGQRKRLNVSNEDNLNNSYFIFCEGTEKSNERIIANFEEVYSKTKDFRKIGSAAIELAWIASARAEGYLTYNIPIWDIAAGIVILNEAGGSLYDSSKELIEIDELSVDDKIDLLATNGEIELNFNLQ